jgi:hypothetical protein
VQTRRRVGGKGRESMKNFPCTSCGNKVYFENVKCLRCTRALGFHPEMLATVALAPTGLKDAAGADLYRVIGSKGALMRYCANAAYGVCNWLTSSRDPSALCSACALNRTIPNLSEAGAVEAWGDLERAKKRLVYSLKRFGLPLDVTAEGGGKLTFDFVRGALTGHQDGLITIDISEADAVQREMQRQTFGEPYRALLGHLRHESGHFYWQVLVQGGGMVDAYREIFGDERSDYNTALQNHHTNGPQPDWQQHFVSSYASMHPWEDWAETWAHYLHIVAAVDTADSEGFEPKAPGLRLTWPFRKADVYRQFDFQMLMARWIPLSIALNSLSRCMGHDDFYPFVIPGPAYAKLEFVHRVIRQRVTRRK